MEKRFVTVSIKINKEKRKVASCYQEEISPMKFYLTMECIEEEIKNNIYKELLIEKATSGKLPDMLPVNVAVGEREILAEAWAIYDKVDGNPSVSDKTEINLGDIEALAASFASRISDKLFHFIPRTKAFRYA